MCLAQLWAPATSPGQQVQHWGSALISPASPLSQSRWRQAGPGKMLPLKPGLECELLEPELWPTSIPEVSVTWRFYCILMEPFSINRTLVIWSLKIPVSRKPSYVALLHLPYTCVVLKLHSKCHLFIHYLQVMYRSSKTRFNQAAFYLVFPVPLSTGHMHSKYQRAWWNLLDLY